MNYIVIWIRWEWESLCFSSSLIKGENCWPSPKTSRKKAVSFNLTIERRWKFGYKNDSG
jgi:hypothetical protein